MNKFIILQYFVLGVRLISGIVLAFFLRPELLGLLRIVQQGANLFRFSHLGLPTFSIYRATGKTWLANYYQKYINSLLVTSFIISPIFASLVIKAYGLGEQGFLHIAVIIYCLACCFNNLLVSKARISDYFNYIHLITLLLVLPPFICIPLVQTEAGDEIYLLSVSVLALTLNFLVYFGLESWRLRFLNIFKKGKSFITVLKASCVQMSYPVLFNIFVALDLMVIAKNTDLNFVGNYSLFVTFVSLATQFYSAFCIYSFRTHNYMFRFGSKKLMASIFILSVSMIPISFIGAQVCSYLFTNYLINYVGAKELIIDFWYYPVLICSRFILPNVFFKSRKIRPLTSLIALFLMVKASFLYFGSAVPLETLVSTLILIDFLFNLLLVAQYYMLRRK